METPCSVMFADLKDFGRISNRDAALTLLSTNVPYGETSLRARACDDRTFLSRHVVHALPGQIPTKQFVDLTKAAIMLFRMIVRNLGDDGETLAEVEQHYAGPASKAMGEALTSFSLDATLYANARDRISDGTYPLPQDKTKLLIMLFVATGCLGDPAEAIRLVGAYTQTFLSQGLTTTETRVGKGFVTASDEGSHQDVCLGLLRLVGAAAQGALLPLSTTPRGTVIGALASAPEDINTVDFDVSRQHLRVFRDTDGVWYARGMGSTNGTILISGDTHERIVVEPPRYQQDLSLAYPPVPIANSDILCLGRTTRFLVMNISPAQDASARDAHRNGD